MAEQSTQNANRNSSGTSQAPAAAVGYSADLLHVQVHHMTGPARDDLPGIAIVVSTGIDEPASAQAEHGQVPSDSAAVNAVPTVGKLVADALSRPLMLTPPGFDLLNDPCRRHVGTPMWRRGSIAQPGIAMSSPSIHPLRRARARDAHLG